MSHISTFSLMAVLVSVSGLQIAGATTREYQNSVVKPVTPPVATAHMRSNQAVLSIDKIKPEHSTREPVARISLFRGCEGCEYQPLYVEKRGVYE